MATNLRNDSADSRPDDRLSQVVSRKKAPNVVLTGALSIAFVLGVAGFVWRGLWVGAVVVMALGLGFAIANSRRDRFEALQLAEDRAGSASATSPRHPLKR